MRFNRSKFICFSAALLAFLVPIASHAATTLTVTPIAWNVIGLDSNNPAVGPANFPIGARVCSSVGNMRNIPSPKIATHT